MKICTGSHQLTADIDQLLAEVTLSVKFVSNLTGQLLEDCKESSSSISDWKKGVKQVLREVRVGEESQPRYYRGQLKVDWVTLFQ